MSPSEKVGPNVVFRGMSGGAEVESGLGETIRARDGRVPWLAWHLERLRNAIRSLGLAEPAADLSELVRIAAGAGGRGGRPGLAGGSGDRVVRLELHGGRVEISSRYVGPTGPIGICVSAEVHQPYRHKTTRREQFGRALAEARRRKFDDALLLTADGCVAEGTAWNMFWWENGT